MLRTHTCTCLRARTQVILTRAVCRSTEREMDDGAQIESWDRRHSASFLWTDLGQGAACLLRTATQCMSARNAQSFAPKFHISAAGGRQSAPRFCVSRLPEQPTVLIPVTSQPRSAASLESQHIPRESFWGCSVSRLEVG